ncbi:MAG: GerMN domain-containing protein [Ilumatobacteraceae bacterium]
MIRRLTTISSVLLGLIAACGIPANGDVSRIPDQKIGVLGEALPTTTTTTPPTTLEPTTTTIPELTSTTIATEDVTLYFISGGLLQPFTRALPKRPSAGQVLAALQEGPPSNELGVGLRSAVPSPALAPLRVSEDGSGVATVDLSTNFFALVMPEDQRVAIGQIVLTLTEVGRIGQVRFTQDGRDIGVPRGSGDFSEPGQALPPRDFLELLQTTATTTTTTTATTTTTTIPVTSTTGT